MSLELVLQIYWGRISMQLGLFNLLGFNALSSPKEGVSPLEETIKVSPFINTVFTETDYIHAFSADTIKGQITQPTVNLL